MKIWLTPPGVSASLERFANLEFGEVLLAHGRNQQDRDSDGRLNGGCIAHGSRAQSGLFQHAIGKGQQQPDIRLVEEVHQALGILVGHARLGRLCIAAEPADQRDISVGRLRQCLAMASKVRPIL